MKILLIRISQKEEVFFFRIHTINFLIFCYILNNKWITPFAIVKVLLSSITSYKRRNSLPRKRSISIGRISLPCLHLISPTHLPAVAKHTNAGRVDSFILFHFHSISNAVPRRIQTLFITLLRPLQNVPWYAAVSCAFLKYNPSILFLFCFCLEKALI